jgi:hypothetical protein
VLHDHRFGFGSICIDEDDFVFNNYPVWWKEQRFQSF